MMPNQPSPSAPPSPPTPPATTASLTPHSPTALVATPTIQVRKLHPQAIIPAYQSAGASGFDFHALESTTIAAGDTALVRTGLAMAVGAGFELQVRPRSGLACRQKISVLNTPGTVDSDYRGEIMILLINHSTTDFHIQQGDRIAQGVIQPVVRVCFQEVLELDDTERGELGFGSSGIALKS